MIDQQDVKDGRLRLPEVLRRTGMSKSEIYRRIRDGRFPNSQKISPRMTFWSAAAVDHYINAPHLDTEERELI